MTSVGPPPPTVIFEWGALKFKGIAENYNLDPAKLDAIQ